MYLKQDNEASLGVTQAYQRVLHTIFTTSTGFSALNIDPPVGEICFCAYMRIPPHRLATKSGTPTSAMSHPEVSLRPLREAVAGL